VKIYEVEIEFEHEYPPSLGAPKHSEDLRPQSDVPSFAHFCSVACIVNLSHVPFYSEAALLAMQSAVIAAVIPFVRPSVTRWYPIQMNEVSIMRSPR